MKKTLVLAILAVLAAAPLTACTSCTPGVERFWEVKDASGVTAYTVDTAAVGFESIVTTFVDAAGREIKMGPIVSKREMSNVQWLAAAGGASWSLDYCGIRKACWANVSAR